MNIEEFYKVRAWDKYKNHAVEGYLVNYRSNSDYKYQVMSQDEETNDWHLDHYMRIEEID